MATFDPDPGIYHFATAIGIGLLIGVERERRKGRGPGRAAAGIRTFAVTSILGAVSLVIGGPILLGVAALCVGALCVVAYVRGSKSDPGVTTEIALLLTLLLGALAMTEPKYASGIGVVLAGLLALRGRLHHFVKSVLTEAELHDGLILAASALVILPLVPNQYVGPYGAINPRTVWTLVVLMMSISAVGYISVRALGARFGLPVAGFTSGFVSSVGTIAVMGTKAKSEPSLFRPAVAGACLSSVATMVQLAPVLAAISLPTLKILTISIISGGLVSVIYGGLYTLTALRGKKPAPLPAGRPFSIPTTIGFSVSITLLCLLMSVLNESFGASGLLVATALSGFADAHSTTASVASLVAAGKIGPQDAAIPILIGLSSNSVTKIISAFVFGSIGFSVRIAVGALLTIVALWGGIFLI